MTKKAIIIGTGFAGCMYALMLRRKKWDVTIIERAPFAGGGVRTFFHGGHPFTYGPRHFLSPYPEAFEFMNEIVPLRHIKKMNYSYQASEDMFFTYPIHLDDVDKMPEAEQIHKELASLPKESGVRNFEEYWISRVGKTLYNRYIKDYNLKAWMLEDNTEMDWGFEGTVKVKPLLTGPRYEFDDWYNCYPIAHDGYNHFFDYALEGCKVLLSTTVSRYDLDKCEVHLSDGNKITGDILVSTISPDLLMEQQYGELRYVGRDFFKFVLPIEHVFPPEVYFIYYPDKEKLTRIVEYKKFTQHKSPNSLLVMEVPSLSNRGYPMMIKAEVERAQKYLDALPDHVFSVGRMGKYRYVDIDDVIMDGLKFSKEIL